MQSVWIKPVITMSFRDVGSPLYVSHAAVRKALAAKEELLVLLEPDGSVSCVFYTNDVTTTELAEEMIKDQEEVIRKAAGLTKAAVLNDSLCIPLSLEKTAVFAVLLFRGCSSEPEEEVLHMAENFAAFLYSEGMGGVLRSTKETLVDVKNLEVTYDNGQVQTKAVKGISFVISRGELCVLEGASGCGKSSALNAVGGMLTPSGGSIWFQGKDIARMNRKELSAYRRDHVGFIFQHYNLIGDLTVAENVEIAAGLSKDPMDTMEALRLVGMDREAEKLPSQLSGGQQQRVCIARAISKRSEMLICDEPTGALDTHNSAVVVRILQDLAVEQGIAVIMITHNPAFSLIAHHCLRMSDGKIAPGDDILQPFPLPASRLVLK